MGFDNVPVPPLSEWTTDLDVFEHSRRIVCCVLRHPAGFARTKDWRFNYRARSNSRNQCGLNHARAFPGRGQQPQRVRLFMKGKDALRRGVDQALFYETHISFKLNLKFARLRPIIPSTINTPTNTSSSLATRNGLRLLED